VRVAAAGVLLGVTVIGLRARGTFSRTPDAAAAGASGTVLVTALAVAEGIALVAFIVVLVSVRPKREPKDDDEDEQARLPPLPWWAKTAGVLTAVACLVTPFAVLLTRKSARRAVAPAPLTRPRVPLTGPHAGSAAASAQPWPLIAGMVIAIALVLALALWSRRQRRRRDGWDSRRDPRAGLASSLAAASTALHGVREPRAAIIACYLAMEQGFAAAGSAPRAADTPAEVLIRAAGAGLVRSGPAEALTGLFRRARYSTEPITGADSATAATALDQMRADLDPAGAPA
jgi:hypothetical protein